MGSAPGRSIVTSIPKSFQPYYRDIFSQGENAAAQAAQSTGGTGLVAAPFKGQFVAQPGALELAGLGEKALLGNQLQGFAQPALDLFGAQLRGQYLNPETNPYIGKVVEAATRPVLQNFQEVALPALQSQALQSGAFMGSSRRDLANQALARGLEQQVGDIASQIFAQNYAQERQLQQQSAQRLDEAARLAQLPPELLLQAGAGFRNVQQMSLDEALKQYEEGINAPFRSLYPLASIIQGTNIGSSTVTREPAGGLGGGITGALGGLGIGAGVSQAAGLQGGGQLASLLGGAGLGGLLGALGG